LLLLLIVGCSGPNAPTASPTRFTPVLDTTVSPLPTSMSTLMPTSLSTLTPTEAEAWILDLLANNAGCRLPCWWGFTPGQTEWQTAQNLLTNVASKIYTSGPSDKSYEVYIPVPERIYPRPLRHFYYVQDGIIERIEIQTGVETIYWLPNFLSLYGPPTEVWLNTAGKPREGSLGFIMVLFYQHEGIMIEYQVPSAAIQGDHIQACPQKALFPGHLLLWAPPSNLTFMEALTDTIGFNKEVSYFSIEDATTMDADAFYDVFKSPDNSNCLQTALELWQ